MKPLPEVLEAARSWPARAVGAALTGNAGMSLSETGASGAFVPLAEVREALAGETVLVTGASSGIGLALALELAASGANVVLTARRTDKLAEVATEIASKGGATAVYPVDLSSGESVTSLLERLDRDRVHVDVLINNAGRSIRRPIEESYGRIHDFERTMALNYFGSVRLILGLLPSMRASKKGHVVNVSSAGVQLGTPFFSAYIASKAALDAFTRVVASETRDDGVHFTTVHMPLVRTPMIAPTEAFDAVAALTPREAAHVVLRALTTRRAEIGTPIGRLVSVGHALAPDMVERLVSFGHRLGER